MSRNKRGSSRIRTAKPQRAMRLHSVKDLLTKKSALLTQLTQHATRQNHWEKWLASHLPAQLSKHVCGVREQGDTLVVFAASAAWSARLRYVIAELEPEMRASNAALASVEVRVLPRG